MRRQTRNNIVIGGLAGCGLTCWLLYYLLHGSADTSANVSTLSERWHAPDTGYEEPLLRDTVQEVRHQVQGVGLKTHHQHEKEHQDDTYNDPLIAAAPSAEEKLEPKIFEHPKEEHKSHSEHKSHHQHTASKSHKHVAKHPKPLQPKAEERTTEEPEVTTETTTMEIEITTAETKTGVLKSSHERKPQTKHRMKSSHKSHQRGKSVHTVGLGIDDDDTEEDIAGTLRDMSQVAEEEQNDQTTPTPEEEKESVVNIEEPEIRQKQKEEEIEQEEEEKEKPAKHHQTHAKSAKTSLDWDMLNEIEGVSDRSAQNANSNAIKISEEQMRQEKTANRGSLIQDPAQPRPQVYLPTQIELGRPKETTAEEMAQVASIHMKTRKKDPRVDWERFFSFIPNGLQACTELFPNLANKNPLPQEFQVSYLEYEDVLKNFHIGDTHIGQHLEQFIVYYFLVRAPFVTSVCETGFGAGHSAFLWLQSNPNVHVYSFDLGEHPYSRPIAHYLSSKYNNRMHVIWGDSLKTLPQFREANKDFKCDIVVIDGGHTFRETLSDYFHLSKMVSQNNLILLDNYPDVSMDYMETLGNVWEGGKRRGEINEIFHCDYRPQPHGFSVGRYILKDLL